MHTCTESARRSTARLRWALPGATALCLALLLAACQVTRAPDTPTPVSMATATPQPEPEPEAEATTATTITTVMLDMPLPVRWESTGAATVPAGARGVTASGPNDAVLTVLAMPRHGLSLARYVADATGLLEQDGLSVSRAGVVYDLRADGAPAGLLEHAGDDEAHAGIQWVVADVTPDLLWLVNLATTRDDLPLARTDVESWLATVEFPAP